MTTRGKKIKQEQIKNLNQHKKLDNLSRNIPFEPPIVRSRGRLRKNVLTDSNNTPFQTKRKRDRPRKQIIEDDLPDIYTKNPSQIELGSDSDSDPEYMDYLKKIQAKSKREKSGRKSKQFIIPLEEESENYFSSSEGEVIDIELEDESNSENSCIEEIVDNKNLEDTFNEQNSEINEKQQIESGKMSQMIIIHSLMKTFHPQNPLHLCQNLPGKF